MCPRWDTAAWSSQRRLWQMLYASAQQAWPIYIVLDGFERRRVRDPNGPDTILDSADYERYWQVEKRARE